MSGAAPTLSLGLDPSVLKSLGDVERMEKAALAGIREIERQALALEKKGQTLTDQQKARLKQFEKLQTEALQARSAVEAAASASDSDKASMRDLKLLRKLDRVRAFQDLASGNFGAMDIAYALKDKNLRRFSEAISKRLGFSGDPLGRLAGGLGNALPAFFLGKGIYDTWASFSGFVPKGHGVGGSTFAIDAPAVKSFDELQRSVGAGATRRSEQQLAFDVNDKFWHAGNTDAAATSRGIASAFVDQNFGVPMPKDDAGRHERIAQLKSMFSQRAARQQAIINAFTSTGGPLVAMGHDFAARANREIYRALQSEYLRTGGKISDKFRENIARDTIAGQLSELARDGKLRGRFGEDLSEKLKVNVDKEINKLHFENDDPATPDRHTEELKRYESHLETVREALDEQSALARFNRYRVPARFNQ